VDDWPWTQEQLEELSYLWDGSDPNWVLLRQDESYMVFNKKGSVLLIESSGLKAAACERMLNAGCEVITSLPNNSAE
jgi:hypothetical protein